MYGDASETAVTHTSIPFETDEQRSARFGSASHSGSIRASPHSSPDVSRCSAIIKVSVLFLFLSAETSCDDAQVCKVCQAGGDRGDGGVQIARKQCSETMQRVWRQAWRALGFPGGAVTARFWLVMLHPGHFEGFLRYLAPMLMRGWWGVFWLMRILGVFPLWVFLHGSCIGNGWGLLQWTLTNGRLTNRRVTNGTHSPKSRWKNSKMNENKWICRRGTYISPATRRTCDRMQFFVRSVLSAIGQSLLLGRGEHNLLI